MYVYPPCQPRSIGENGEGEPKARERLRGESCNFQEKLFRSKKYKTRLRQGNQSLVFSFPVQTKLSKSLTLDNGTDHGDLPFHAAHAITVDGCIRLMQTMAVH